MSRKAVQSLMSMKAVIIWLVAAVLLGIAAIVLLRAPSGLSAPDTVAVGERLLNFRPGEVESIVVAIPGEPVQIVERPPNAKSVLGADAEWQFRSEPAKPRADGTPNSAAPTSPSTPTTPATPPSSTAWPLNSAMVQSLLRKLSETRTVAIPAVDSELGAASVVEIRLGGSRLIKLSLAERTIIGIGLVQVEIPPAAPVRAMVKDELHDVFTQPGPRAWRERFPIAGIAPDTSRITVTNNKQSLSLSKLEGQWLLAAPVAAPADAAAVQRLLANLERVAIVDFLDAGTAGLTTGLDTPVAMISVQADRRSVEPGQAEAKTTTDTLTLAIGSAADTSSAKLFGSINKDRVVLLESRSLVPISADAAQYVWPYPLRQTPSDIGIIAISLAHPAPTTSAAKSFKRSGAGWAQVLADKTDVPLSASDQREPESLITFLTGGDKGAFVGSTPAASSAGSGAPRPTIALEAPKGYEPIGSIVLSSLAGAPLETLELGAAENDQAVIRTREVYRVYTPGQLPTVLRAVYAAAVPQTTPPAPGEPARPAP